MRKVLVFVLFIFLIVALSLWLITRDSRTAQNLNSAIQNGSEAALQKTVGKAREQAMRMKYEVRQGLIQTRDAMHEGVQRADQIALDASCTAAIKMKFASDKMVPATRIDVNTQNGVVTLTGLLTEERQAVRAVDLAYSVKGVIRVISKLQIQQSA